MSRWTCSVGLPEELEACRGERAGGWSAPARRWGSALLLAWAGTAAVGAQPPATPQAESRTAEGLVGRSYRFEFRPAAGAIAKVEDLLSARGSVELQRQGDALFVRDTEEIVRRVLARLRDYDQPPRRVELEIQIVRAGGPPTPGMLGRPQLPADLARRLRDLLRFETFILLARTAVEMAEGEQVAYDFGGDYRVEFELGELNSTRQLRLRDFIVGRGQEGDARPLIHTNLNLMLERPMVLGLAPAEDSERALMVVLTSHLAGDAD